MYFCCFKLLSVGQLVMTTQETNVFEKLLFIVSNSLLQDINYDDNDSNKRFLEKSNYVPRTLINCYKAPRGVYYYYPCFIDCGGEAQKAKKLAQGYVETPRSNQNLTRAVGVCSCLTLSFTSNPSRFVLLVSPVGLWLPFSGTAFSFTWQCAPGMVWAPQN